MIPNIQNVGPDQKGRVYGGLRLPRFKEGFGKPSVFSVSDMNRIVDVFNSFLNLSIVEVAPDKPGVIITDSNVVIQKPRPNKDLAAVHARRLKLGAYWTFDGPTGDQIDSVAGLHLVRSYTSGSGGTCQDSNTPGIISDGLEIDATGGTHDTVDFLTPSVSQIGIDANGFSIFGWFKQDGFVPSGSRFLQFLAGSGANVRIQWTNSVSLHVDWKDDNGTIGFINFSTGSSSIWVFYHLFYDPVLQQIGFSMNAGAPTMGGTGLIFGAQPTMSLEIKVDDIAANTYYVIWDETGIATGGVLSSAQVTSIYNGGAAVTWPAVKSIVES